MNDRDHDDPRRDHAPVLIGDPRVEVRVADPQPRDLQSPGPQPTAASRPTPMLQLVHLHPEVPAPPLPLPLHPGVRPLLSTRLRVYN